MKQSKRILVIEDNPDSRFLLVRALRMEGHEVLQAENGIDALTAIEAGPQPDVVLMDLSMPEMDGEEFLHRLRARPEGARMKVIVVSGWDDLASRARQLGADGSVRKPVDLDALADELDRVTQAPAAGPALDL